MTFAFEILQFVMYKYVQINTVSRFHFSCSVLAWEFLKPSNAQLATSKWKFRKLVKPLATPYPIKSFSKFVDNQRLRQWHPVHFCRQICIVPSHAKNESGKKTQICQTRSREHRLQTRFWFPCVACGVCQTGVFQLLLRQNLILPVQTKDHWRLLFRKFYTMRLMKNFSSRDYIQVWQSHGSNLQ